MSKSEKTLKSNNLKWLWSVVALDSLILVFLASPELMSPAGIKSLAWLRVLAAGVSPVVVLLLTSLLSADAKAVLVFWRLKETLPGHRAFSVFAPNDPRINLDALKKNAGAFPEDAKEQNALWYKLYKKVDSDLTVAQAHRHFLLFRDLAALSLVAAPCVALLLYFLGFGLGISASATLILLIQYSATAVAARNNGIRFVTNVMALHAVKRRT